MHNEQHRNIVEYEVSNHWILTNNEEHVYLKIYFYSSTVTLVCSRIVIGERVPAYGGAVRIGTACRNWLQQKSSNLYSTGSLA